MFSIMSNKVALTILLAVVVLGAILYYRPKSTTPNEQIFCAQDVRECPGGSFVGRIPPTCEFAECPATEVKEETTASLNQKILNKEVFITPIEVVSDSRCPVDVQCIWAGEVNLKVLLEKGNVNKEVTLKLGTPVTFEGNNISLINVIPEKNTKNPFNDNEYRFTFLVTPLTAVKTGTISGTVTTSPTCPVERIPPEPQCAPRPFATAIEIRQTGKTSILKTIRSDTSGKFNTELPVGSYELKPISGSVFPSCSSVTVQVISGQNSISDISCDTGIR